ncbi:caspase family protein [bacterium]|nr:caspase family protein [bacterium]
MGGITSPSLEVDRSGDGVVDYWAVIVGIEDYQFITDLSYTIDDAVDMKDVLVSYSNWNDSNSNIQLLTDVDASKENIELFVNTMVTSADEDDVCLFFFSGHGSRIPDEEDGDEADTFDEVICPYNTTKELGYVISDDELGTWLSVYSGNVVVILDTCMSGGFTNSIEETVKSVPNPQVPKDAIAKKHFGEGLVERLKQRPISRDLNQTGYVVLMACEEDKSAYESRRLENGVFTYYIVEGLWGPADANSDNKVSAEEDFNYADPLVLWYKPTNQDPQLWDGYYEGDLPLVIASTSIAGTMYVESITFFSKVAGPNKFLYTTVKVVDGGGIALEGVRVEMTLSYDKENDGTIDRSWDFAGDTGTDGTVKFTLNKVPSGHYTDTVTNLILTDYMWDTTKGIKSESCELQDDGTVIQ